MAGTVFIFGLGYVGRPLGHRLAAAGWQVRGTTRAPSRLVEDGQSKGGTFAPPHLTFNSIGLRRFRLYHTKGDQSLG